MFSLLSVLKLLCSQDREESVRIVPQHFSLLKTKCLIKQNEPIYASWFNISICKTCKPTSHVVKFEFGKLIALMHLNEA